MKLDKKSREELKVTSMWYEFDGVQYPRNTTIVSHSIFNPFLEEWKHKVGWDGSQDILKKAQKRGTTVHQMIEDYSQGKLTEIPKGYEKYIKVFDRFIENYQPEFLDQEETYLINEHKKDCEEDCVKHLLYATTVDGRGLVKDLPHRNKTAEGKPVTIEYKTSKRLYPSHIYQLAAENYAQRASGDEVMGGLVVRFSPHAHDEHYFTQKELDGYFRSFKAFHKYFMEFVWPERERLISVNGS